MAITVCPLGSVSVLLKGGGATGLLLPPAMMLAVVYETHLFSNRIKGYLH
jgi:hypothetical protein